MSSAFRELFPGEVRDVNTDSLCLLLKHPRNRNEGKQTRAGKRHPTWLAVWLRTVGKQRPLEADALRYLGVSLLAGAPRARGRAGRFEAGVFTYSPSRDAGLRWTWGGGKATAGLRTEAALL